MAIKESYTVEKRNDLNALRVRRMTLQQLRLFAIYLSRINARDESTRCVRFSLSEFRKVMGLGRLNVKNIDVATDGLLCQIVKVPRENGGFEKFQLFKKCKVDKDDSGEWYVEIDAHDEALQLFFDFKRRYFVYEVGNVLRLSSPIQIRMYEILKQHERQGRLKIALGELRELLGIQKKEYLRFWDFKVWVLDATQVALAEQTDIKFDYEKVTKNRKVIAILFTIQKNDKKFDSSTLEDYIAALPEAPLAELPKSEVDIGMEYADALPPNLTAAEVEMLRRLAAEHIPLGDGLEAAEVKLYDYLDVKTKLLYAQRKPVRPDHYFAWLRRAVAEDWT